MTTTISGIEDEDALMGRRTQAIAAFAARQWTARSVPWIGALLIGVIVVLAATDIIRSYRKSIEATSEQLETHASIIAEQTARSVQAVDVVLRYIAAQFHNGALSKSTPEELHNYLKDQAVGLVQSSGLAMHAADGTARAISWIHPAPENVTNVASLAAFRAVRDDPTIDVLVGDAVQSGSTASGFFRSVAAWRRPAGDLPERWARVEASTTSSASTPMRCSAAAQK